MIGRYLIFGRLDLLECRNQVDTSGTRFNTDAKQLSLKSYIQTTGTGSYYYYCYYCYHFLSLSLSLSLFYCFVLFCFCLNFFCLRCFLFVSFFCFVFLEYLSQEHGTEYSDQSADETSLALSATLELGSRCSQVELYLNKTWIIWFVSPLPVFPAHTPPLPPVSFSYLKGNECASIEHFLRSVDCIGCSMTFEGSDGTGAAVLGR